MYCFESTIELGLKKGQKFPNEDYRIVARNIAIYNPKVRDKDLLTEIIQSVLRVPKDRIRTVTVTEMINEFGLPENAT